MLLQLTSVRRQCKNVLSASFLCGIKRPLNINDTVTINVLLLIQPP